MPSIRALLNALDERTISREVGSKHDEARMQYQPPTSRPSDFREFEAILADYYRFHFCRCVSPGGDLSQSEARSRAKEVVEQDYRRRGGDRVSAFKDARDGTNNGLRGILDIIADDLKEEAVRLYMSDVLDRHVNPVSWEEKVEIIRRFMAQCGDHLSSYLDTGDPERYAGDYEEFINAYVRALREASPVFRRL